MCHEYSVSYAAHDAPNLHAMYMHRGNPHTKAPVVPRASASILSQVLMMSCAACLCSSLLPYALAMHGSYTHQFSSRIFSSASCSSMRMSLMPVTAACSAIQAWSSCVTLMGHLLHKRAQCCEAGSAGYFAKTPCFPGEHVSYLQLLSGLSQCIVELLLCGLGNCPTASVSIPLGMMTTSKTCMSDVPFDMPVRSKIKLRHDVQKNRLMQQHCGIGNAYTWGCSSWSCGSRQVWALSVALPAEAPVAA